MKSKLFITIIAGVLLILTLANFNTLVTSLMPAIPYDQIERHLKLDREGIHDKN